MTSATAFRTFLLSAALGAISLTAAFAQEAPHSTTTGSGTKDGRTTTERPTPAPMPVPSTPPPVYRPAPNDQTRVPVPSTPAPQAPAPKNPAPVYRPAPNQPSTQAPAPAPQQQRTPLDRRYDLNGDGELSKAERKRMKDIRKAEKKQAKELRKAERKQDHSEWVDDHKREMAAQGLEARQNALKAHGNGRGHGKDK